MGVRTSQGSSFHPTATTVLPWGRGAQDLGDPGPHSARGDHNSPSMLPRPSRNEGRSHVQRVFRDTCT